jgi:hypothetical protein
MFIGYGTGGLSGHTTVCVWFGDELWVIESTGMEYPASERCVEKSLELCVELCMSRYLFDYSILSVRLTSFNIFHLARVAVLSPIYRMPARVGYVRTPIAEWIDMIHAMFPMVCATFFS